MLVHVELIFLNYLFMVYYSVFSYPFIDGYLDCGLFLALETVLQWTSLYVLFECFSRK